MIDARAAAGNPLDVEITKARPDVGGCRVAIVARAQRHIDAAVAAVIAEGGEAIGISADMTQETDISRAVAEITAALGAPLIVITQADFHVRGFFDEIDDAEAFVESYRTYTMSQVYMLRAVGAAMKQAGWGRYVHIGSATAKEPQNKPPHTVANGTRPSTVGLLKSVADEYARFGITINTIAPGWIATKTTNWYLSTHEGLVDDDSRRDWMIDKGRSTRRTAWRPGRNRLDHRLSVLRPGRIRQRSLHRRRRWAPPLGVLTGLWLTATRT